MTSGQELYLEAKRRIPGGTQLLSKRPEMYLPDQWPSYYSRSSGYEVWDLEGRRFIDTDSSIGAAVLGFADPDVDAAVKSAIDNGSVATLNCPEEVELAELLCEIHPWADMVRYTRAGGEAMTLAVRAARAHTRRSKVLFCGYHGWHDWYLAANLAHDEVLSGHLLPGLEPLGVPRELLGTALPFRYNHPEELEALVTEHKGEIAAVVMEPLRGETPEPGFLERVRELATEAGAVFIVDEITAGFRFASSGAHRLLGIEPDIAVFAKAMSNGYPMAAVLGRARVMEAIQGSFISSTSWTERIGPVAALATIRKHTAHDVGSLLVQRGALIQSEWQRLADRHGLHVHIGGMLPISHFDFIGDAPNATRTLYTQCMLDLGYLSTNRFYVNLRHDNEMLSQYFSVVDQAFAIVAAAITEGTVETRLRGPVAHSRFKRLA
ncbi:MAG: aminotransferase class III-fold pyridoxal phosphate-dependent enzyme [Gemmatimonadota bacterium]